jgi:hypothetical protein
MARKSAALRLSQSQELLAAYTAASIENTRGGRFLADMISRLQRGKGLSKGQRNWLDGLVEEGVPTPKGDPAQLAKIDAAVEIFNGNLDRQWESNVLVDFRGKFVMGWDLSEKQQALLEKILQRADDDATGANVFTPTQEQRDDLEALVKLYKGYSSQWQAERPAVAKAVHRVTEFLAGNGTIEEYHNQKLHKAMKSRLRTFSNPRFQVGALGWFTEYDSSTRETTKHLVTSITDAYITERGEVANDWLLPSGQVVTLPGDRVSKRRG